MSDANDPAYPAWDLPEMTCYGLTKRELIAAMAMQGFAADPDVHAEAAVVAVIAVKWADALLAELAKGGPK